MYFTTNPNLYMSFFAISIFAVYMLVRLRITTIRLALVLGMMLNSMFVFLYSLARGNAISQALVVGAVLGAIFTIIPVGVAAIFQTKSRPALTETFVEEKAPVLETTR